jgi:hypothetical protein
VVYARSLGHGFLTTWDDGAYVLQNPLVTGFEWRRLGQVFSSVLLGNYAPLHTLSYAAQHALWGLDPRGYHAVSIVLHAANAWLAFDLVGRFVSNRRTAFAAALLWAVHPVNVESVAWVSQTKTLFATLFALASLRLGLSRREGLAAWALPLFGAAVLFKASVVTLPLVVWAHGRLLGGLPGASRRTLGFALVGLAGLSLGAWAQVRGAAVPQDLLSADALLGTVYPTMLPALWEYVRLFFWPLRLCGFYDAPARHSFTEWPVVVAALGWVALAVGVARGCGAQARFWAVWVAAFLLPAANLLPLPVYYADRYLYLSGLGLCVLLVLGLQRILGKTGRSWALAALLLGTFWAGLAWQRVDAWGSDEAFWQDVVRTSPGIYKGHLNLGVVYEKSGRLREAEREYAAALALFPSEQARSNLEWLRWRLSLERGGATR